MRHRLGALIGSAALALTLLPSGGDGVAATSRPPGPGALGAVHAVSAKTGHEQVLGRYVRDTWKSVVAMTDPTTGLPADNVGGDLTAASRSRYTSPTNIGAYLWSTVVARDTGLITASEARGRLATTLGTLETLDRHEGSGMFYNWYDPATGAKLTTWPENGDTLYPFLSSVDNGWLATGLLAVARADSQLTARANALRGSMDFGWFYDANAGVPETPGGPVGGQISGGFWDAQPTGCSQLLSLKAGTPPVYQTCHRYGAFNTEPRMASYLGIAAGQIPAKHYFGTERTFPPSCDWSWTETKPTGYWTEHEGVSVYEGALPYRDVKVVPTWGGSMFEALMVPLFVPEETWGPTSWGVNHPLYVRGQIQHGLDEAGYGYWGFSPSNNPAGGYREYGVDQLGMDGPGYTSDQERTTVDQPYEGCPDRAGSPAPTAYGDGVVTPHASFLAMRYAPAAALANLQKLRSHFDAYGPGGFYDAVAVRTGQVSHKYLSLDQGMIMAALGNRLAGDDLRHYVSRGALEERVRPLMAEETFSAGMG